MSDIQCVPAWRKFSFAVVIVFFAALAGVVARSTLLSSRSVAAASVAPIDGISPWEITRERGNDLPTETYGDLF